jgi:nicotinate dehydrogenase subunit B
MSGPLLSRRRFGQALGALTIAFSLAPPSLAADAPKLPGSLANNRRLDAWLRINADGTVTVFAGKVELGQGILTAFEQIVADGLDIEPSRIRIISGDTAQTPDEGFTSGSQSMEYGGTALRHACAEAQQILLDRALAHFDLAGKPLDFKMAVIDGTVLVGSNDRTVTYWELAGEIDLHREATGAVPPKPPGALRYIGKSRPRRDIPRKVTGGIAYVQDIRLPGMLYGRISRPPSYGAALVEFDEARVRKLIGVVDVVRDGRFLGVIAEREEWAIAARDELARAAKWHEEAQLPASADIYRHLKSLPAEEHVIANKGDGAAPAARVSLDASVTRPYTARLAPWRSSRTGSSRCGRTVRGSFRCSATLPRRSTWTSERSAASTPKARAATATTAPTTWPSTRRCWRAPPTAGRSRCSGCATTSSAGSRSARR